MYCAGTGKDGTYIVNPYFMDRGNRRKAAKLRWQFEGIMKNGGTVDLS